MRAFPATLVSLLLLAAPTSASPGGDDREEARNDARQAAAAFNLGHYEEAASLYERAYELVPDPVLLYDLGQSRRLNHQLDDAVVAYRSYLRTSPPDAPNRQRVEELTTELEQRGMMLTPRQVAPSPPKPRLSVLPRTEERPSRRWVPWVGAGVTAALGVAAIFEGLSANATFDELRGTCGKTRTCTGSQLSPGRTEATVTNVLWGLTAASAAVTGVAFYFSYAGGKEAGMTLAWRY